MTTYFTKQQLVEANREAIMRKRTMKASDKGLSVLPDDKVYPVAFHMWTGPERNPVVRCEVIVNDVGSTVWIDVDPQGFNQLAQA